MENGNNRKLSSKEVAALLGIPLVKVQRWVHQGTIPCKYKKDEYFFKKGEILEWAREHDLPIMEEPKRRKRNTSESDDIILSNAIQRGGVHYHLHGEDIFTVLQNAIQLIQFPVEADKNLILDEILFRESVASTGIGKGVAIPHLKDVRHLKLKYPIIPVFFLDKPIDFNSIDGQPVFVLFFIFTPAPEVHLKMLSRLSYCLHDGDFVSLLKNGVGGEVLLDKIEEIEAAISGD